jgi:hypothetical protein
VRWASVVLALGLLRDQLRAADGPDQDPDQDLDQEPAQDPDQEEAGPRRG